MSGLKSSAGLLPANGRLFHASRHDEQIAIFDPLTHFGTLEAALARSATSVFAGYEHIARVYEVEVEIELDGASRRFEHPDPAEAYGMALLALIERTR